MKFIDFFAGIGGFRRGMELAGHEFIGFCEFDKFATASYISMHLLTPEQREFLDKMPLKQRQKEILKEEYRNGEWYANDIRRVYAGGIPKADCWCFGFPCQDISVAGKQAGFQGNRSSLFFRVMYLVGQLKEDKPTFLFIENVKNLLSVNGGWDFARLLIEMEQGGYDAEWQVLNSKDFGVPQNRERCFIIGHLRGRSTAKIFPIEGTNGENSISLNLFGCLNGRNSQRDRVYSDVGLAPTISTKPGENTGPKVSILFDTSYPALTANKGEEIKTSIKIIGEINSSQDGKILSTDGIAKCHSAGHNNNPKIALPVLTPDFAEKRQNGRRFKENGEPMFTLTGQDRHGVATSIPVSMSRNIIENEIKVAHCLNANDSRKFFGKNQRGNAVMEILGCIDPQGRKAKRVAPRNEVPTLRSQSHGNEPNVCVKVAEATKQGYSECRVGVDAVNLSVPGSKTRRGRVGKEVANTLDTSCNQGIFVKVSDELIVYAVWYEKYQCYIAIRKLTPKECFRLQGWSDDYFEKAQFVNSDSQLYKQAGNGVTVSVIKAIAEKLKIPCESD